MYKVIKDISKVIKNMNIDNVVMVRATNTLPLNGELIPCCEGFKLVNDRKSEFFYFMYDCVKEELQKRLGRELDLYDPADEQLADNTVNYYSRLTGDYYTTTLSFSLNGLVPDDNHNKFSDKKMAVLEPIKNQTNADFVTVETIDVTTKGRMKLSDEAMLVIENQFFSKLSPEIQENLAANFKLRKFDGKLKTAIEETLKENGFPVLQLIQEREKENIEDCPEKESMLDFEDKFSKMVGASRQRLHYLTYMYAGGNEFDKLAHDKISEEHSNTLIVEQYYNNQFYEFMINKAETLGIQVNDKDKHYLYTDLPEGTDAMKRITTSLIEAYGGLENFSEFLNEYNQYAQENYLTNKEIISLESNKRQK